MKKIVVVVLLALMATVSFAADWAGAPVMPIVGRYGATVTYTMTSDTAVTLETAYGSGWASTAVGPAYTSGVSPIGFLVSVETNGGRVAFGGTTPTVDNVGHVLASGSSMQFMGPNVATTVKITNEGTSANAVYQITPIYQQ